MYYLLSGHQPFHGTSSKDVYERIKEADYKLDEVCWQIISVEARDLVDNLL